MKSYIVIGLGRFGTRAATRLYELGCDVLAIPCNTAHGLLTRLQQELTLSVLDMVEETVTYAVRHKLHRVAILATDGTLRSGLYQRACAARGLEAVVPDEAVQRLVMQIIYDRIKAGHTVAAAEFGPVDSWLRTTGCDGVLLACTELSVLREQLGLHARIWVDAMQALADAAILACGGKVKEGDENGA